MCGCGLCLRFMKQSEMNGLACCSVLCRAWLKALHSVGSLRLMILFSFTKRLLSQKKKKEEKEGKKNKRNLTCPLLPSIPPSLGKVQGFHAAHTSGFTI